MMSAALPLPTTASPPAPVWMYHEPTPAGARFDVPRAHARRCGHEIIGHAAIVLQHVLLQLRIALLIRRGLIDGCEIKSNTASDLLKEIVGRIVYKVVVLNSRKDQPATNGLETGHSLLV